MSAGGPKQKKPDEPTDDHTTFSAAIAPCPPDHLTTHPNLTRNPRCTACYPQTPGSAPRGKHRRPPRLHRLRRLLPPNPRMPAPALLLGEGACCCTRWGRYHRRRVARVVCLQRAPRSVRLFLFLAEPTTRPHRRRRCCLRKGLAEPFAAKIQPRTKRWLEALGGTVASGLHPGSSLRLFCVRVRDGGRGRERRWSSGSAKNKSMWTQRCIRYRRGDAGETIVGLQRFVARGSSV